jgi:hypothetical protein
LEDKLGDERKNVSFIIEGEQKGQVNWLIAVYIYSILLLLM